MSKKPKCACIVAGNGEIAEYRLRCPVEAHAETARKIARQRFDSRPDTHEHIATVRGLVNGVAIDLLDRGHRHDRSKLASPEVETFDAVTPLLANMTYGSDEYKATLAEMGIALGHHYRENRHHPEHAEAELEWRQATIDGDGWPYEVSNLGDVRNADGKTRRAHINAFGYARLQLAREGTKQNVFVHRLVAEAFVENPDAKPEVNHRDGDKLNNAAANLEWVTRGENVRHAHDAGLVPSTAKWVVRCEQEDLVTLGSSDMARKLRERGYDRAESAGILRAAETGGTHLGLSFDTMLVTEWQRSRVGWMNLLDLTEMLCDWIAATRRHPDGDIHRSIDQNAERFGYGDEIRRLLHNSVEPLLALERPVE